MESINVIDIKMTSVLIESKSRNIRSTWSRYNRKKNIINIFKS